MSRSQQRAVETARFIDSHEALAGLSDAAFRAARRTGNDPVSLTTIATTIGGYRARIEAHRIWLEQHHPSEGSLFGRAAARIEQDVGTKLKRALEPDDRFGPDRTATGEYDPSPETTQVVQLWGLVARNRKGIRRSVAASARRRLERLLNQNP